VTSSPRPSNRNVIKTKTAEWRDFDLLDDAEVHKAGGK
jgi:hypothetical protein